MHAFAAIKITAFLDFVVEFVRRLKGVQLQCRPGGAKGLEVSCRRIHYL
jgi:hypothetical protein